MWLDTAMDVPRLSESDELRSAVIELERLGREGRVTRRFWRHLANAAKELGLDDVETRLRTEPK